MNHTNRYYTNRINIMATSMTANKLLTLCPLHQIRRSQRIYNSILDGEWDDAIYHLENAMLEEAGTTWGLDAAELRDNCKLYRGDTKGN